MAPVPPLYLPAPTVVPYEFGLLSVAQQIVTSDPHWQNGIEYEPYLCGKAKAWPGPCSDTPDPEDGKAADAEVPLVTGLPFTIYAGFSCKLPGRPNESEIQDRARQALALGEQRAVEEQFWTGEMGGSPILADPAAVVLNANPVPLAADALSPVAGLAALESYLGANYGGRGVIHAPRGVIPTFADHNLIEQQGARLVTTLGTWVAAGGGYPNTGPDGTPAPDGTAWLYATGAVVYLRSEVFVNPPDLSGAFNRTTNEVNMLAERIYLLAYECLLAAVLITINC